MKDDFKSKRRKAQKNSMGNRMITNLPSFGPIADLVGRSNSVISRSTVNKAIIEKYGEDYALDNVIDHVKIDLELLEKIQKDRNDGMTGKELAIKYNRCVNWFYVHTKNPEKRK